MDPWRKDQRKDDLGISRRHALAGAAAVLGELTLARLAQAGAGSPAATAPGAALATPVVELVAASSDDRLYPLGQPRPKPDAMNEEFALVRPDGTDIARLRIPMKAHSVIGHPTDQNCYVALSKEDSLSAVVDLQAGRVIELHATAGLEFAGHGLFLPRDPNVVVTGLRKVEREIEGQIVLYDRRSGRLLDRFTSHGPYPHEMRFLDGGRVLAVVNGGLPRGNVAFIDMKTRRCLEKLPGPPAPQRPRHFVMLDDGSCLVGTLVKREPGSSEALPPAILLRGRRGGALVPVELRGHAPRMLESCAQYLSLAYAPDVDVVGATASGSRAVVLLGLKEERAQMVVPVPEPNGIVLSPGGRSFLVSTVSDLVEVDALSGAIVRRTPVSRPLNSSHLTRLDRPRATR